MSEVDLATAREQLQRAAAAHAAGDLDAANDAIANLMKLIDQSEHGGLIDQFLDVALGLSKP